MNVIYKIFFDKLNKNNSLGSKGSIEVYLRDNLKFLIGRKKSNIKVFIKKEGNFRINLLWIALFRFKLF